jgi:hypothetical protein
MRQGRNHNYKKKTFPNYHIPIAMGGGSDGDKKMLCLFQQCNITKKYKMTQFYRLIFLTMCFNSFLPAANGRQSFANQPLLHS